MSAIKSLLKEVVQNLPEGSIKAQSVVPQLMKKGVKAEELGFAALDLPTTGKVSKQQLVEAEAKRKDKFYTTETKGYQNISLPAGKNNPTYKMKVLSFNEKGIVQEASETGMSRAVWLEINNSNNVDLARQHGYTGDMPLGRWLDGQEMTEAIPTSRYTSSHTDVPDYLAHTRIYDEDWDGVPVRVLQEIQSDLHQQGRQRGYDVGTGEGTWAVTPEQRSALENIDPFDDSSIDDAYEFMSQLGADDLVNELGMPEAIEEVLGGGRKKLTNIPKSPHEKTWLRKGIERELVDAIEEGRTQLAIPISGNVGDLVRAEGVQKWYETQVVNTAKKVAKASGSEFEMVSKGKVDIKLPTLTDDFRAQVKQIFDDEMAESGEGRWALEAVNNYIHQVASSADEANRLANVSHLLLKDAPDADILAFLQEDVSTGVRYAVIKPKGQPVDGKLDLEKPFSFSLYSSPAAAAGVAYMAYSQGASEEQVAQALEAKGYDMADVDMQLKFLVQAVNQGSSVQEAVKYLEGREQTATTVSKKPPSKYNPELYKNGRFNLGQTQQTYSAQIEQFQALVDESNKMDDKQLVAALQTVYPVMSSVTTTDLPSMWGSEDAIQARDAARSSSRVRIQQLFEERTGKKLYWKESTGLIGEPSDEWAIQDEQGNFVEVTPGFLNDLAESKYEILGAISGSIGGFALGAAPGAIALGTAGTMAGAETDYLDAAMRLQLDLDAEAAYWNAATAGEVAVISEAILYPATVGLKYAWRGVAKAVTKVKNGDTAGGYEALKETTFLSDDQIEEIVTQVKRFTPLKGTKTEQGIQAVTMTRPGMEHVISASQKYGSAGEKLTETIRRRTEGILAATKDLTDDHVARMLGQDLQNYVSDVKQSYGTVKARAVEAPDAANFSYSFKDLAIMPILEETADKIFNPAVRDKFLNHMGRIRKLTEKEGFGNLIELRQLVNDFLYNTKINKADDKALIRGALGEIDEAIKDGAHNVVENPKQWLEDWAAVKSEYAQMKGIEKSALYRAITDKSGKMRGLTPDQVVKRLTKYITALDGSFEEVMAKLPVEGRKKYEGAVIDHLTNKYTMENTAIHFPQLAEDLAKVNFTTPDARAMKKTLTDLADVFKNDLKIVNASTGMHIPSIMQGLSDNLLVKLKYEIASKSYAKLRAFADSEGRHRVDLLQRVGSLIEAPLNQKNAKELLEAADNDANLAESVLQLQREAARQKAKGQDIVTPRLHFYGSGSVKKLKGEGPVTAKIPKHRIVDLEQARIIAESEYLTLDSKQLDFVLKERGYQAIMQGSDSIRILK